MAKLNDTVLEYVVIHNKDEGTNFKAQYNPKEISFDRSVPWQKHKQSKADSPVLEFTSAEPSNLSCELFCDLYEEKGDAYKAFVEPLLHLTKVKQSGSDEDKRPPKCIFMWGKNFPRFEGVIESVSVKYTMFLADGTPCRATATIKMKQADKVRTKVRKKKKNSGSSGGTGSGERGDPTGGTGGGSA